ncbi:MAG: serine/threonine-protein kinase [Cyanobacteriota bacterium]|nr:serine/threonine-protein kinase [Cyanobacteriota bacterium]
MILFTAAHLPTAMSIPDRLHCVNPNCPAPYPQPGHHKFCLRCGTSLRLSDRYIPLQRLGSGGFATIYTVWDLQTHQERVLKVLAVTSPKALKLFEQEAIVLGSLRHPGIPKVEPNSFFLVPTPQQQPLYCLVMEKIVGPTLEDVLTKYFPQGCPETLVLDWLCQATDILETLHRRHIIHRDIKPSNLMLREFQLANPALGEAYQGQLVLIDLGGAKQKGAKDSSTRLFSSGYSPPEQLTGQLVEPAADIYALGRTAIHLLTGQHPVDLEELHSGALEWRSRVSTSPALTNLLEAMVQWEATDRPQTAREVRSCLARMPGTPLHRQARTMATLARTKAIARQTSTRIVQTGRQWTHGAIAAVADTTREMWGGAVGSVCGVLLGFFLADLTPLGELFARLIEAYVPRLLAGVEVELGPEFLLFACVGLGTGWGLAAMGGLGQRVQRVKAGLTGFLGYSLAWLAWVGLPGGAIARFLTTLVIAAFVLPLGLGLSGYRVFQAFVAALGTALLFGLSLVYGNLSGRMVEEILLLARFDLTVGFCSLLGMGIAMGLAIAHYLLVPLLQWLGTRNSSQ